VLASCFLLSLLFDTEVGRRYVPSKRRAIVELHGVTSRKAAIFSFRVSFAKQISAIETGGRPTSVKAAVGLTAA
jgi:hypothetical protein